MRTKGGDEMRLFLGVLLAALLVGAPNAFAFAKKPSPAPGAVQKYACPMQCILLEKPGKCPECGMELWEVSAPLEKKVPAELIENKTRAGERIS